MVPARSSSTALALTADRRRPVPGQWVLVRFVAGHSPAPISAWATVVALDDEAFDATTDNADLLNLAPGSAVASEFTDGTRMQLIEGAIVGVAEDVVRVSAHWPQDRRTRARKHSGAALQVIRADDDPSNVEVGTVVDVSPIALKATLPAAVLGGQHLMLYFELPTGPVRSVAVTQADSTRVDDAHEVRLNFLNADDASMAAIDEFLRG